MGFSEENVKIWLKRDLEAMSTLYQKDYINFRKKTNDTKKCCYEVIAEYLLDNLYLLSKDYITELKRKRSYKSLEHKELSKNEKILHYWLERHSEDKFAQSLYLSSFDHIGKIIDYQIPLKITDHDKKVGEIDLIAYNNKDTLSLIELKREYNHETLLRAILEISTYRCQVFDEKLLESFNLPSDTAIKKVVMIFKDRFQHQDFNDSLKIRELAEKLEVTILILDHKVTLLS